MAIASATDDRITVVTSDIGQKGDTGTAGLDGQGFNGVRQNLLDSPLCRLFTPNKLVDTLAGSLTATRASSATYVDRYGVVKTAAIDEIREESEGWLIEGASTNLCLNSEDFSSFLGGNATVTTNTTNGPNGTLTADTIEDNDVGPSQNVNQSISGVSGDYTFSVFLKKGTSDIVSIASFAGSDNDFQTARIDMNTNSVLSTGGGAISARIKVLSDGWIRVSLSCNASVTQLVDVRVYPTDVNDASLTGTVFAWGAQLEELPFASSYIPTTSAAATRAADDISAVGLNNIPLLSKQLSVSYTANRLGYNTVSNDFIFSAFADDNLNLSHSFWSGGNNALLVYYSGNLLFTTIGTDFLNSMASTYDESEFITYKGGNAVKTDTLSYTDASDKATNIQFGAQNNLTQPMYGHIRDFRIYDFALNADEAQYLAGVK